MAAADVWKVLLDHFLCLTCTCLKLIQLGRFHTRAVWFALNGPEFPRIARFIWADVKAHPNSGAARLQWEMLHVCVTKAARRSVSLSAIFFVTAAFVSCTAQHAGQLAPLFGIKQLS